MYPLPHSKRDLVRLRVDVVPAWSSAPSSGEMFFFFSLCSVASTDGPEPLSLPLGLFLGHAGLQVPHGQEGNCPESF